MRIAMIGHKEYPSYSGGVEAFVSEFAPSLVQRGYDVTVYNRGLRKDGNRYEAGGVNVRRVFTVQRPALHATISSFLATFDALEAGYDVLHYHAIGPSVPLFLAKLLGRHTVCTVHGLNWKVDKWKGFASWYLKLGEKIAARYADELVVLSRTEQDYFYQTYGRKATWIPNAIPYRDPLPANLIMQRYGLKPGSYILYVGRISPEKGTLELMEAYQRSNTGKKLVLAGPLPEEEYAQKVAEHIQQMPDILPTGYVTGELLQELYSNCALFVLPSHTEGLSLSLLQALSVGVRCLVSDIPENTAVIGPYGATFPSGDTEALGQALEQLTVQPDSQSRRSEQIQWFRRKYDYHTMVERYEEVYRRVMIK